jgi:hypothetical protein
MQSNRGLSTARANAAANVLSLAEMNTELNALRADLNHMSQLLHRQIMRNSKKDAAIVFSIAYLAGLAISAGSFLLNPDYSDPIRKFGPSDSIFNTPKDE